MITSLRSLASSDRSGIAALLFVASAAFVAWRNSEVGVLVDIGYILNTATRIALGDVPYADFPLAQAPGTFLIQAGLIKLFGPHYAVQIAYASVVGGLATTVTFLIVRHLLRGAVRSPGVLAAIMCIPLIPLGVYGILPNPFYDPDACLVVLVGIGLILAARDRPTSLRWLLAGAVLTVPLLIKQNIGGAYLLSVVGILGLEAIQRPASRRSFRYVAIGIFGALGCEVLLLQVAVGLDNYVRWVWTWALTGRGVSAGRLSEFTDPLVLWPGALLIAVAIVASLVKPAMRGALFIGAFGLILVASVFSPGVLLNVPQMFPPLLIASCALAAIRTAREGLRFDVMLPFVLAATTIGTLQSQGVGGSTYGIFPILILAIAAIVRDLAFLLPAPRRLAPLTGALLAAILATSGTAYTILNVRLGFVDVNAPGPVLRSTYPSLAGLSARGPYVADLDTILFWMKAHVPEGESFAFVPGEEPAYFALGRKPALPSVWLYVGDIATPYTHAELASFADRAELRWVVVKDELQVVTKPPQEQELVTRLTAHATLVVSVGPYRVFRR